MKACFQFWAAMGGHTLFAAGTFLLGKAATDALPALVLGLIRFGVASLIFWFWMKWRGHSLREPLREKGGTFVVAGFLGVVMNQVLFAYGLRWTLPSHAALLYALTPAVVLLLGWIRGVERPTMGKGMGILLAFLGVAALFLERGSGALPPRWIWGDLLLLGSVAAWAGYSVISRPLVLAYGPERTTELAIFLGSALFLPVGCVGLAQFHPGQIPAAAWVGALYLSVIGSVVMYLLWFRALSLREPSRVAIVANGQPILTALLGWIFYAQPVSPMFGLGAALVMAGVVITQL